MHPSLQHSAKVFYPATNQSMVTLIPYLWVTVVMLFTVIARVKKAPFSVGMFLYCIYNNGSWQVFVTCLTVSSMDASVA